METTLYLIRHGEVEYLTDKEGHKLIYGPEIPLSTIGEQQLNDLADQLLKDRVIIDTIFSSPYVRAKESSAILHKKLDAPVVVENNLHDLWMPGWFGKTMDYLHSLNGNIHNVPPLSDDQETLEAMIVRIITVINKLVSQSVGKTIAIVSHGDPLAAYIQHLEHPDKPINVDHDSTYPAKGQAIRVVFNEAGKLAELKHYEVQSAIPKIVY